MIALWPVDNDYRKGVHNFTSFAAATAMTGAGTGSGNGGGSSGDGEACLPPLLLYDTACSGQCAPIPSPPLQQQHSPVLSSGCPSRHIRSAALATADPHTAAGIAATAAMLHRHCDSFLRAPATPPPFACNPAPLALATVRFLRAPAPLPLFNALRYRSLDTAHPRPRLQSLSSRTRAIACVCLLSRTPRPRHRSLSSRTRAPATVQRAPLPFA